MRSIPLIVVVLAASAALGLAALGQAMGQPAAQPAGRAAAPAAIVPWQSLAQALPTAAPGRAMQGQIEGSTVNAMGFAMIGNMSADTSESRSSRVNFGAYPGMQNFQKTSNSADVTVVVGNRIIATVKVSNAGSEAPALQLAQMINYALLASLIGG